MLASIESAPQPNGIAPSYSHAQPIESSATKEDLAELSQLLLYGKQREAAEFAVNRCLWSHALIISSSIGPDSWAGTIQAFSQASLTNVENKSDQTQTVLKAAYSIVAIGDPELASSSLQDRISDEDILAAWRGICGVIISNGKTSAGGLLLDLGKRLRKLGRLEASHVW